MANAKNDRFKMKHSYDETSRVLKWEYPGTNLPAIEFTVPSVTSDNPTVDPALINGYKQKIADVAAIARNTETGADPTPAEKHAAMTECVTRLTVERVWNATRQAASVNVDALVAAVAGILKKDVVKVRAFVESKDEKGRAALAGSKEFGTAYATTLAKMRVRTAAPTELLDELAKI